MATSFPAGLDALTNPTGADTLGTGAVLHSAEHANANDAIEALEAAVGITGSADTASLVYKLEQLTAGPVTFVEVDGVPSIARKILRLPNNTLIDVDANTAQFTPLFRRLSDVLFTSYSGLGGRSLQIKADESGVEAVAPYDLVSLSGVQLTVVENAGASQMELTVHPPAPIPYYWSVPPFTSTVAITTAVIEWPNNQRRQFVDLTYAVQARIVVRIATTAFTAGTKLAFQYSTDETTWNYLDAASGPSVLVATTNQVAVSAWVNLAAGAKADVFVRLVGVAGDNTVNSAVVGPIMLQVR